MPNCAITATAYKARYQKSSLVLTELQIPHGLAAGVYTQTTDIEGEITRLVTCDRKRTRIPASELEDLHKQLQE